MAPPVPPLASKPSSKVASAGFGMRNLVSTMRSFVPLLGRAADGEEAVPAAGKKLVKAHALSCHLHACIKMRVQA